MADYDYGNARLHVMKSRLLPRRELETLADKGSLQGLIAALTKTVYQKSVEAALTRTTGMQCIDEALRNDLVNTIGQASWSRSFYELTIFTTSRRSCAASRRMCLRAIFSLSYCRSVN
jgi:vacuolar-type H+-ATPase subunit C/Vma6